MTFPTGVIEIRKCSDEELKTVLDEAREAFKHSRKLDRVMGIVAAHRLKKMRELLSYQELATWRRMNGFDRVLEGEENWLHGNRSLPPTPEQHTASLRLDFEKLKHAISMPAEDAVTRPRQKTMDAVHGRRSDSLDELLTNFEFARIKEYVEKRSREAAQVQVTVTQVDTVQHSSPCPLDPEPSSDVCIKFKSKEGKIGPELEELKSSSAGTGLKMPGQQCPPNEGIWEQGRTTANGFLTAGVDTAKGEESLHRRKAWTRGPVKRVQELRQTPPSCSRATNPQAKKTSSSTPVERWKRREGPPWNAAVTLLSFSAESWETPCCASCFVAALCVLCFPNYFSFPGDHFSAKLKNMRGDADQGSSR